MVKRKRIIDYLQNNIQKTKDWTTRTPLKYQCMWVIWLCNVYYKSLFSECGSPWQEWWMYEGVSGNIYTNMNIIKTIYGFTCIYVTYFKEVLLIEMVEASFSNLWKWAMLYDWLAHVIVVHMVCPAYHNCINVWLCASLSPVHAWFKYIVMRVGHFLDKSIYWL